MKWETNIPQRERDTHSPLPSTDSLPPTLLVLVVAGQLAVSLAGDIQFKLHLLTLIELLFS